MKTFLKWHVPVAARWQAEPGRGERGRIPGYPLNILTMFPPWPQNHSNVSLPPLRPRTRALRGDRPAARAPRRHRCQGRSSAGLAGPGLALAVGGVFYQGFRLRWPGRDARSDIAAGSVHVEGKASWPGQSSWPRPPTARCGARRSWPWSWLAGCLGIRSQARVCH